MKVVTISDVHGEYERFEPALAPAGDVYIFAGDLTHWGLRDQSRFNIRVFAAGIKWLSDLGLRGPVLAVPGNHDIGFGDATLNSANNCKSINGIRYSPVIEGPDREWSFVGVSMSPCYNLPVLASIFDFTTFDPDQETAAYDLPAADIVVSHCPPYGVLDVVADDTGMSVHIGSRRLLDYIGTYRPILVVCGHAHGNVGSQTICSDDTATLVVNCAEAWGVWDSDTGVWQAA